MGHAAFHLDTQVRDVGELEGIVGERKKGFGKILADLGVDDIKGSRKLDITDVIPAQVDVHQSGDAVIIFGILIELDTLHQR